MENNYLSHHGIKGQKWGVRRFQNEDGSLTAAGKRRLGVNKVEKLQKKATNARTSANEWDEMADHLSGKRSTKRRIKKIDKYRQNAAEDRAVAEKYDKKVEQKIAKKYSTIGDHSGKARYELDKGENIMRTHEKNASSLEALAKKYDDSGSYGKAELMRRSAETIRARGENLKAEQIRIAERYMEKSNIANQKASALATATNVKLGKKKVDSIIAEADKDGYNWAKAVDEINKEVDRISLIGQTGNNVYKYATGK